jgi:hypothetical protein
MPNSFSQLRSWFKSPEPQQTKALVPYNQNMSAAAGLAANLALGLGHVQQLTDSRLQEYFGKGSFQMPELQLYDDNSPLFVSLTKWELSPNEYLTLMIALAPSLQPNFYDILIQKHLSKAGEFPEFGGIKNAGTRTTSPTGDTVLFLLNGTDLTGRLTTWQQILSHDSRLIKQQIVLLEDPKDGEPVTSGRITVAKEYVEMFLLGREWQPRFSSEFPAQPITSLLEWENLIVSRTNQQELKIIQDWLEHEQTLKADTALSKMIKPGYRALFYGPPGTGKTLTAALLGKLRKKPVYRVDLSQMVSKYIGETSKIASNLFDIAENRNWILFFDEADSLFGKRTSVTSSNDRYANQDVSYLLQRVEDYNGLIILASNYKHNIDNAFMRRFQSVIHFSMPDAQERLTLWQQTKPIVVTLADDISFEELAQKFDLSGASILNVMYISTIRGLADKQMITRTMLIEEIRKELAKDNKTI